jgi:hypothetical protein
MQRMINLKYHKKMKKATITLTLAITFGVFVTSNVFAIDPISFSTDKAVSKTEMIVEKDIKVQDWMMESNFLSNKREANSREKSLELENWMIESSWVKKEQTNEPEPKIEVENWMLKSWDSVKENKITAFED